MNKGFVHHRRSIRLEGYDYRQDGAYFVTVCVAGMVCVLGEAVGDSVRLNAWGQVVEECWQWLAQQYPYVELDEWVVMPNHFHGILVIVGGNDFGRGGSRAAPTDNTVTNNAPEVVPLTSIVPIKRKPLGQLIGAFKTVSTKRINEMRGTPGQALWQRNYWEHIIRSEIAMNHIRGYIQTNPARWSEDRYYR